MKELEHTKEPWTESTCILIPAGTSMRPLPSDFHAMSVENYHRAIECVNAFAGIDEPSDFPILGLVAENAELKKKLHSLSESHKREVEALERKAWECSVEMMEQSDLAYSKEVPSASILTAYKRNGEGRAWKNASYKLRKAFGFPKSETPEKFK